MSGKYWEKYQEKRLKPERSCKTPTHTSDKQAYITSLETQLEKTSSSTILMQTFAERIDQLQRQLNTTDEKVANLARLIKLQASDFSENFNTGSLNRLEERLLTLEQVQKVKHESFQSFSDDVERALKETEKKIAKLVEDCEEKIKKGSGNFSFAGESLDSLSREREKIVKEAAENAWIAQQTCNKLAEDALMRISGCEKRIKDVQNTLERYEPDLDDVETKVMKRLDQSIESLAGLMKNYAKTQEVIGNEIKEMKEKFWEDKNPGVFSFGATFPNFSERSGQVEKGKSEKNSRENSKDPENRSTRKRSASPSEKSKGKEKKEEMKVKKKTERKNRIEKLYQHFSEKNS
jgi:hypothetical protein